MARKNFSTDENMIRSPQRLSYISILYLNIALKLEVRLL